VQQLCTACSEHHETVKKLLSQNKISFVENRNLVRGLDYYTGTVFEFKCRELGSQDALGAGGRYNSLIQSMGGPDTPAIGWAFGVDRVAQIAEKTAPPQEQLAAFVVGMGNETTETVLKILNALRGNGISADWGQPDLSVKSQMRSANKSGARFAVIIGSDEMKAAACTVKDLTSGGQETIAQEKLADYLASKTTSLS
jgi:histidyl-tRNA synthetase